MSTNTAADDARAWHRRFAADANNRAWTLVEQDALSPAERTELLHTAHAAAHHWSAAGGPDEAAHADLLLGAAHARLGHASLARGFARAAFDRLAAPGRAPWEIALAHAVVAAASDTAGDASAHARHWEQARTLTDALADADERAIVQAFLRHVPAPA